jgi:hypothetical protein
VNPPTLTCDRAQSSALLKALLKKSDAKWVG